MGGDRGRAARPGGGADRVGQDAVGVPLEHRPAAHDPAAGRPHQAHPGALRQPAQGAGGRRRAQPAQPAHRHPAHRRAAGQTGARGDASACAAATPRPSDRRKLVTQPPDILITTPESLFLMLTSQAREGLRGVETVIIDEVHAVAGTKRGAHLAVSLERLDALLDQPAQRIGLSATVRPLEEVARFLGGSAPVEIVAPPSTKEWDLQVVVPVEDMTAPGAVRRGLRRADPRPVDLAARRGARRRPDRAAPQHDRLRQQPAALRAADRPAQRDRHRAGHAASARSRTRARPRSSPSPASSTGAETVIAKAHHGSVSKEQRALIEDDLKRGRLPAVVATSSLELGIDMGAVDLVVQIESPPSVASALQRVGRAGHQVGEVSRGVLFPKHRGDLAQTAVAVQRMRSRRDRVAPGARQPARRARPAGRRRHRPRRLGGRGPLRAGQAHRQLRPAPAVGLRRRARPAQRPLPERRVRRAPPPHRLGPRDRRPHRAPRRPAAGGHQRRHHPRPRPVRRLPRRRRGPRQAGRRARRGDGLRVPRR